MLIAPGALAIVDLPIESLGGVVDVLAQGAGDSGPAEAAAAISGLSLVPPAPVHLAVSATEDGGVIFSWVRRSRLGWRWIDGADAPLGEEVERYRVTISPVVGPERVIETLVASAHVTFAEHSGGATLSVRQLGSHGASPPAALTLAAG